MASRSIGTAEATLVGAALLVSATNQTTQLVYAYAVQHLNVRSGEMTPSHKRLANLVGCTERTIRRSLVFLIANGLLLIRQRGNQHRATVYVLGDAVTRRLAKEQRTNG